jgi:hypothetical protein
MNFVKSFINDDPFDTLRQQGRARLRVVYEDCQIPLLGSGERTEVSAKACQRSDIETYQLDAQRRCPLKEIIDLSIAALDRRNVPLHRS